jgi:hypothetical protein
MDEKEKKMQETVFFVEANSFESFSLWNQHHEKDLIWREDNCGFSQIIGCIDGDQNKPVNVTFMFAVIFGSRICFYDVCSRFSDSEMVEKWIETNYPRKWANGTRRAMTNAQNFHHAIDHCRTLANVKKATSNILKE